MHVRISTLISLCQNVQMLSGCVDMVLARLAELDDNSGPIGHNGAELVQTSKRMTPLQGRDDAIQAADAHKYPRAC